MLLTARSASAAAAAAQATGTAPLSLDVTDPASVAVCPGWVATDMGGPAGRPVAAGAASVVWAATLRDSGPTGGFFRDGRLLPW